jgi:hypothetical protein
MKKKRIDKLYQEKLKDFGQIPDEHVWASIAASLDNKKKKRRVIPIWWRLGGVASVLAIVLFLVFQTGSLKTPETILTDTNNGPSSVSEEVEPVNPNDLEAFPKINSDVTTTTSNKSQDITSDTIELLNIPAIQVASETGQRSTNKPANRIPGVASEDLNSEKSNTTVANNTVGVSKTNDTIEDIKSERLIGNDRLDTRIVTADIQKNKSTAEKNLAEAAAQQIAMDATKSPRDLVSDKKVIDNTSVLVPEKNSKKSIFEDIPAEDVTELSETNDARWTIGPKVAPVYFSSLTQGSPIHSSFQNNAKSGNVNFSYGLSVSYNVSKKLQLRSGIHKVDYGYDTNDVSFSSSLNAATNSLINNIDYTLSSKNLVVKSVSSSAAKLASESAMDVAATDPSLDGRMIQEFGYLEVPVELTYAVFDRKLGLNVIGGVSSLFLINNSVILESEGIATQMGEANNINDVNLSTNIGIGFSYSVGDKMIINLEPMFKYQLNTFSNAAGNFRPYSIGVYSGLTFKF